MSDFQQLQSTFAQMVPELQRMAGAHFRHLDPEGREESVQNSIGLAWKHFHALIEKERGGATELIRSCLFYAIRQTKAGRSVQGSGGKKAKDVYVNARRGKVSFEKVDPAHFVSDATPVPDQASFRVDVPDFFNTLNERQRSMTEDLMMGRTTAEVAAKHKVTPSAISQWRSRFKDLFDRYFAC